MVDPVLAMDGVTYDREQIEAWFQEEARAGRQRTSPQTREPLTDQLIPNVAMRCTIQRLIDSGLLEYEITEEWHTAKETQARFVACKARDEALARFPVGTAVELPVCLKETPAETASDVGDFCVDVHSICGRDGTELSGRLLFQGLSARRVFHAMQPSESQQAAMRELD